MEKTISDMQKEIISGNHKQFIVSNENDRVECRCGLKAVWLRTGYLCGSITARPCKYNFI